MFVLNIRISTYLERAKASLLLYMCDIYGAFIETL